MSPDFTLEVKYIQICIQHSMDTLGAGKPESAFSILIQALGGLIQVSDKFYTFAVVLSDCKTVHTSITFQMYMAFTLIDR